MRTLPLILLLLLVSQPVAAAESLQIPIADSPSRGAQDAPVTIIEFIDFQ